MSINRRELMLKSGQLALGMAIGDHLLASQVSSALSPLKDGPAANGFPAKFLWGAATAAHQVQGNNLNSDAWPLEHLPHSMYKEPFCDACDHYHLFEPDINLLADLGLNAYRFSIEWARIEPEKDFFSNAELEHYRRVLEACHRRGLTPLLTYSHFTVPRWFALQGAWENAESADFFAPYCEKATAHLGDLIAYSATFNEPDILHLLRWMASLGGSTGPDIATTLATQNAAVRRQLNARLFNSFLTADAQKSRENMLAAHTKGKSAIKSVRGSLPVGLTLAMEDDQPAGPDRRFAEKEADVYGPWLKLARQDDFIGVQTCTRQRVALKNLPTPENAELTQMGYEFYPESLEHTVRYASKETGVPVIVTENGIGTEDDARRVEYIHRAGLKRCLDDGLDIRGYIHWSLLDIFEWNFGYVPKFGLIAVDRETQKRTVTPSATMLGKIAKSNS